MNNICGTLRFESSTDSTGKTSRSTTGEGNRYGLVGNDSGVNVPGENHLQSVWFLLLFVATALYTRVPFVVRAKQRSLGMDGKWKEDGGGSGCRRLLAAICHPFLRCAKNGTGSGV